MEEVYHGEDLDDESMLAALRGMGGAPSGGASFDPLRGLGEDVLEMRMRANALSGKPAAAGLQVDLHDEKELEYLEDKGLRAHMDEARELYLASERREPLALEALAGEQAAARRALSALMTGLKEQQMALQCACDVVLLAAENANRLMLGTQPHGFSPVGPPPAEPMAKNLATLSKHISGASADLGGIAIALDAFERDLTLARRSYEGLVESLMQRCAAATARDASKGNGC
jgi:hypothetical protein